MTTLKYQAHGQSLVLKAIRLTAVPDRLIAEGVARPRSRHLGFALGMIPQPPLFDPKAFVDTVRKSATMRARIPDDPRLLAVVSPSRPARRTTGRPHYAGDVTILTTTLIVEGARTGDLKAAMNDGARLIHEGYDGKALLAVDRIEDVGRICALLIARDVGSVSPNFLRRFARTPRSLTVRAWAHSKLRLAAAWKVTKGRPTIRVAVLDEGVDTTHPALAAAVVGQRDFIGDKGDSALPDGDDAHGTACAGIIVSRGREALGIAPRCSLLTARIAMDDGSGHWVFDDYATADAIDWCWRQGADVLSNSWGGGAPSDAISRAFGRARTQGRGGKGSVVCIAAGNDQTLIDFPGNLPGYITVGATNPADERKTRTSSDGENWWGSNYGPTLWLMAPGVFIPTTDISGPRGYETGDYTATFNGTSSAAPHVAGAAALMLSANPNLSSSDVRRLLRDTARPIEGQKRWARELGHGRLDIGAAVAAASKEP